MSELNRLGRGLECATTRLSRPEGPLPGAVTVGIDIVDAEAVSDSLALHPTRYPRRVYTDTELDDSRSPSGELDPLRLAARFAAKEATLKALGVADDAIPWQSIGVRRDSFGRPSLRLTGAAAALARERGVEELDVSLTHEGRYAAAVVIARGGGAQC